MSKFKKSMPLSVKIPVTLAAVLAVVVISIMLIEHLQNDKLGSKYRSCRVQRHTQFAANSAPLSLMAAVFRGSDGLFRGVGLHRKKREWALFSLDFDPEYRIHLNLLEVAPNDLENVTSEVYSARGHSDNHAVIGLSTGEFFTLKFADRLITAQNKITLCGSPWPAIVQFSFLNRSILLSHGDDGRIAFFNTDYFGPMIPRGIGKHPDSLVSIQTNNRLENISCDSSGSLKMGRISSAPGRFVFSSGEGASLALYELEQSGLKMKSTEIVGQSGFSDFYLSGQNLAIRSHNWLDRDANWRFLSYNGRRYNDDLNTIKKPLRHTLDYTRVANKPVAEWILQESGYFFKTHYLTKVFLAGEVEHFEVPDGVFQKSRYADPWISLPQNKHLVVHNQDRGAEYSILECE